MMEVWVLVQPLCGCVASISGHMNTTDFVNTLWGLAISQNQIHSCAAEFWAAASHCESTLADRDVILSFNAGQPPYTLVIRETLQSRGKRRAGSEAERQALNAKIIAQLQNMHQNIGMTAWGISSSHLRTSKRLAKALIARATDVIDEMNWQTIAHVEYFLLSYGRSGISTDGPVRRKRWHLCLLQ